MSATSKTTHFERLKKRRTSIPTKPRPVSPLDVPSREGDWLIYRNGVKVLDPSPRCRQSTLTPLSIASFNPFFQPGATMHFKDLPPLNTPMPEHAGTFAGIAGGKDGQPYAAMILLDAMPPKKLNWLDACAWGESLGDGAHIPTRDESALLYANVRDSLDQDDWHWTSTPYNPPYSDSYAWIQNFSLGGQNLNYESTERLCRAVRLIQLSA